MEYLSKIVDICRANLSAQHKQYMLGRGFSASTIEDFQVGTFSMDVVRQKVPLEYLSEKKIMFRNKNGKYWSEFDNRVIIPIFDHNGTVVGITGRVIGESDRAKYCNSGYNKGGVLFGLDKAKRDILVNNAVVIVEGNLDVMAAFESGVRNVVAICGTAMTERHVHLLLRYCNRFILSLDNDKAGEAARLRSLEMLNYYVEHDLVEVAALQMPDGVKDINELTNRVGTEDCRRLLINSIPAPQPKPKIETTWEWTIE